MSLNFTVKMIKIINFMICIFYYNKNHILKKVELKIGAYYKTQAPKQKQKRKRIPPQLFRNSN
jgi:hypothetical protein